MDLRYFAYRSPVSPKPTREEYWAIEFVGTVSLQHGQAFAPFAKVSAKEAYLALKNYNERLVHFPTLSLAREAAQALVDHGGIVTIGKVIEHTPATDGDSWEYIATYGEGPRGYSVPR